jgi:Rrf2 family protein
MLALTRKTEYALIALTHLAKLDGGRASARDVAERYRLSASLLMNVLKELAGAGLVESIRGAGGGYRLARPPEQIDLVTVIEAVERPVRLTACATGDTAAMDDCSCGSTGRCPICRAVSHVQRRLQNVLENVTLAEMIEMDAANAPAAGNNTRK